MILHHFIHQAINGAWHAVYRTPGCGSLTSIGDATTKHGAEFMAHQANLEQEKTAVVFVEPHERRIVPGFYTDAEAA